jgi:hypothetical protein
MKRSASSSTALAEIWCPSQATNCRRPVTGRAGRDLEHDKHRRRGEQCRLFAGPATGPLLLLWSSRGPEEQSANTGRSPATRRRVRESGRPGRDLVGAFLPVVSLEDDQRVVSRPGDFHWVALMGGVVPGPRRSRLARGSREHSPLEVGHRCPVAARRCEQQYPPAVGGRFSCVKNLIAIGQ